MVDCSRIPVMRVNPIKYWREMRGLTQKELADRIGAHRSTVARIESGDIKFTVATLIEICRILRIRFSEMARYFEAQDIELLNIPSMASGSSDYIPLVTEIPPGPWESWYPGLSVERGIPRCSLKGEALLAFPETRDAMMPKIWPDDIVIVDMNSTYGAGDGRIGAIRRGGILEFRQIFYRGSMLYIEPYNTAYKSDIISVGSVEIFKIVDLRKNTKGWF